MRHGLNTFEGFWDLPRQWVEDSNVRRKGWSGAIRHTVVDGDGRRFSMFVKLQENHNYRSPSHLLQWRPTLYRELLNIRRMERIGVPTTEPVFYAERRDGDKLRAILATAALQATASSILFLKIRPSAHQLGRQSCTALPTQCGCCIATVCSTMV